MEGPQVKLNYVVACYLGTRSLHYHYQNENIGDSRASWGETLSKKPLFFIEKHLQQLASLKTEAEEAAFVFNIDEHSNAPRGGTSDQEILFKKAKDLIENYGLSIDVKCIRRPNQYFSYGAWDHYLRHHSKAQFSFLIEDDYLIYEDFFERHFLDKIREDPLQEKRRGYVCQLYEGGIPPHHEHHCAISNGLVSKSAFDKSDGFFFGMFDGPTCQYIFHRRLLDHGFEVVDVSDVCKTPFLTSYNDICWYGKNTAFRINGTPCGRGLLEDDNDSLDPAPMPIVPIHPSFVSF